VEDGVFVEGEDEDSK